MGGGWDADDCEANDTAAGEEWISQSRIKFRIASKDVESTDTKNNGYSNSRGYIGEGIGA